MISEGIDVNQLAKIRLIIDPNFWQRSLIQCVNQSTTLDLRINGENKKTLNVAFPGVAFPYSPVKTSENI